MVLPESVKGIIPLSPGASASGNGKVPWRLVEAVVDRSIADNWHHAKIEWELVSVCFSDPDEPGTCLCGHTPIIELCLLCNRENGNTAVVGNHCVRRFLDLPSEAIFRGLRRIARDPQRALGSAAIQFADRRGWLSPWERKFLLDTTNKRRLSTKVLAKRVEINAKVLRLVGQEGAHARS
jgi:hypothetical protein